MLPATERLGGRVKRRLKTRRSLSAKQLANKLRLAERRLRQLEQRYELAMGAINESVYDWDIATGRFSAARNMQQTLGLPGEQLSLEAWQKRIHPDDYQRFRTATLDHLKAITPRFQCDYRYRAADGSWRWARTHGAAVRDKSGRAVRMVGSTGDITELKRTEAALQASEERYALATSAAVEGIYEWNVEAAKLYLTEQAKAFFSLPGAELTPAAWNSRIHGDDYAGYRNAIAEHFKGRTPLFQHEYRIADAKGGYKWVLDRGIGVRGADGRVRKMVGAVSDITRRKRAEMELRRARDEAEEALEQQAAAAEVLSAINASRSDTKPVFDKILTSCQRLFEGHLVGLTLTNSQGLIDLVAYHGPNYEQLKAIYPVPISRVGGSGYAILEKRVVHFPDVSEGSSAPETVKQGAVSVGFKSIIFAPLLAQGEGIGALWVGREFAGPFSDKEIALLKTFADQAVIAIENARLFNETKEALEQQKASAEVLSAISSSIADARPVFDKILQSCQRLFSGRQVAINLVAEDGRIVIGAYQGPGREELERIAPFPAGASSGSGAAIAERRVKHYPDAQNGADVPEITRRGCAAMGVKAAIFAPMLWKDRGIGVIFVGRDFSGPFSDKEVALLETFADQAAIAIENARLFREIQEKSAQLEVANKHKSDFLANMSHELRTPLNAIIGFSEALMERMFGELNEKQLEYQKDIHESGKHLLSLINDILDLSKIEAGRMELELSTFHLPAAVSNAVTLIRERAQRHGVSLGVEVDPRLGEFQADERKVKQILLNLLSNAVKFTPDGGRVDISAKLDTDKVEIAVKDTGVGITPEDQASLFEEFKQFGNDSSRRAEGTGLGLALTKRLIELHGGQISVDSTVGQGSSFRVTLPIR
jgi:PAS domain S-box-containing protein